jgi:uncharacterized protein
MPLFVFIGYDGPDGATRRQANRERHVANLEALDRAGQLVYGGPIRDAADRSIGALLVLDAPDLAAAQALIDQDPYVAAGVFARMELNRFVRAFPRQTVGQ